MHTGDPLPSSTDEPLGRDPAVRSSPEPLLKRYGWVLVLALGAFPLFGIADPDTPTATCNVNIPSQDLDQSLQEVALTCHRKLLYSSELVQGKRAPALQGQLTPAEAVQKLLAGSNLTYEVTSDGLLLIRSISDDVVEKGRPTETKPPPPLQNLTEQHPLQELVVTGSRIPRTESNLQINLTSASPITLIDDDEIALEGTPNIENLINNLPAAFPDYNSTVSNGATGTANLNLRDLGVARTLVLVDGKRLMPGDPAYPFADVNAVPAALVDHVEVLTGGASAVYGSDALAGVVNFVMKKDFQGVLLDAQYGFAQHNQHEAQSQSALQAAGIAVPANFTGGADSILTFLAGMNAPDDAGNVTVYAGYRRMRQITEDKYDFSACPLGSVQNAQGVYDQHVCTGSQDYNLFISQDLENAGASPYQFFAQPNRTFTPYAGQTFNYAPYNYLQRPDDRYTLGESGHYQVNPMVDVYSDFMFTDDHTVALTAPSGLFIGTGDFDGAVHVNCNNPLMSAQQASALGCGTLLGSTADATLFIGRRDVEGGGRTDDLRHRAFRLDIGARGLLDPAWSYDIYGQYGRTLYDEMFSNDLSVSRVQNALEVVTDTRVGSPTYGKPICKVVLEGIDPSCVPLDVFGGIGSITPQELAYVGATGFKTGYTEEDVASGSLTGNLGDYGVRLPAATTGVGVALGAEYRREAIELNTSQDFQTGDLYGQGAPTFPIPLSAFHVSEIFGEARIPVVEGARLAKRLQLETGFRRSDYSSVGVTNTWKMALSWQPEDDFAFRGSLQRAVRAPNVLEFYSPTDNVLFSYQDPCAGADPQLSQLECERTGVTAAEYGHILPCPGSLCRDVEGGNPALKPESSLTKSLGLVFTPRFAHGFNATIDYFDINVQDIIRQLGGAFIVNQCANTGQAYYCNLITRGANGSLFTEDTRLININQNTGYERTQGVDLEANYHGTLAEQQRGRWGSLAINVVGTWLRRLEFEPLPGGGPSYDCAGLFGVTCQEPAPRWRSKLRVSWQTPWQTELSIDWRHLSAVTLDLLDTNPQLNGGIEDTADATLRAQDYVDLTATWKALENVTLRFGVNNVFDRDPPLVDSAVLGIASPAYFGNANTFPGTYDSLGRTLFVGISATF